MQVKHVTKWCELGTPGDLGEAAVDHLLELVVQLDILDGATGDAHEVMMMRQQRLAQLEMGALAARRDPVDDPGSLKHLEVPIRRTQRQIGSGRGDLRQRDWTSRAGQCLDQPSPACGVAAVVASQAGSDHRVEFS